MSTEPEDLGFPFAAQAARDVPQVANRNVPVPDLRGRRSALA